MRTTKRFSPAVIERFRALGRGTGTFGDYIPWHRVSRSDPASSGRSHLIVWRKRQRELLSDTELTVFCFATRIVGPDDDLREQFPLSLETSRHEMAAYDVRCGTREYPGTLGLAGRLGIKHPKVNGEGRSTPWVMSTDLLVMNCLPDGSRSMTAIAVKSMSPAVGLQRLRSEHDELVSDPRRRFIAPLIVNKLEQRAKRMERVRELLVLEKAYWEARGVPWLLITPNQYDPLTADTLARTWPWALLDPVSQDEMDTAAAIVRRHVGCSLTQVQERIATPLRDLNLAQSAFWQAIWSGRLPVDFRRGWRPHIPVEMLPQTIFDELNPVWMRRSA